MPEQLTDDQASGVRAHRETLEPEIRFLEAQQEWLEALLPQARETEWRDRLEAKLAADRARLAVVRAAWEQATADPATGSRSTPPRGAATEAPARLPEGPR
jgi:hypothetical protein